jgi:hypothetical protein
VLCGFVGRNRIHTEKRRFDRTAKSIKLAGKQGGMRRLPGMRQSVRLTGGNAKQSSGVFSVAYHS